MANFDGIKILIFADDHPPPHVHARHAGSEALISIATGKLHEGFLPIAQLRLVQGWVLANLEHLAYIWVEVQNHRPAGRIDR